MLREEHDAQLRRSLTNACDADRASRGRASQRAAIIAHALRDGSEADSACLAF